MTRVSVRMDEMIARLPIIDTGAYAAIRSERSRHRRHGINQILATYTLSQAPLLSLTSACGIFVLAIANNAGRTSAWYGDLLFWIGILILYGPPIVRLIFFEQVSRHERIEILALLGLISTLARVVQYPLGVAYFDEYEHLRTAQDILSTGHLFQANPMLPVSPAYPGLEVASTAFATISGLPLYISSFIVIAVARVVLVVSLYLAFELLMRSTRIAATGAIIYMLNANFLFFDAQFAYETLALPLAVFILLLCLKRRESEYHANKGLDALIVLALAALTVTHHITSLVLIGILTLWALVALMYHARKGNQRDSNLWRLWWPPALALGMAIAWLFYTHLIAYYYLASPLTQTVQQLSEILHGKLQPHHLFTDGTGYVAPLWEQYFALVATGIISLISVFGVGFIGRGYRRDAFIVCLLIVSAAYPLTQLTRYTVAGADIASRSIEFIFIGVALVAGVVAIDYARRKRKSIIFNLYLGIVLVFLLIGGIIIGVGPLWNRLPGPYLPIADAPSITPQGITAATWTQGVLGANHIVATDRDETLLMGTYGEQQVLTQMNSTVLVAPLFTSATFDLADQTIIQQGGIQYIAVDTRLSEGLPRVGFYYDQNELHALHYLKPIPQSALLKFDAVPLVSRVYDNGAIVIYNVSAYDLQPGG